MDGGAFRVDLSRGLIPALLVQLLFGMFRFSVGVVLPYLSAEFLLSSGQAGIFVSAILIATGVPMALTGYLYDTLGRSKTMISGTAILTIGCILSTMSPSFTACLASFFIASIGAGILTTSIFAFVGETTPNSRGLLLGLTSSMYSLGGFFGPLVATALTATAGWRPPFQFLGLIGLLILAAQWSLLRGSDDTRTSQQTSPSRSTYAGLLRNSNVATLSILLLLTNFAFLATASWMTAFLLKHQGLEPNYAGLTFGLFSLAGMFGSLGLGALSDRIGRKRIIGVSFFISVLLSCLLFERLWPSAPVAAIAITFGFFVSPHWPLQTTLAQDSVDPALIGTVTGLVQNVGMIGGILGPGVAGALMEAMDMGDALLLTVSLPLMISAIISILLREKRR